MLTITKHHKHLCYRKDGNRLGRRKERSILAKTLERSMLKHEINSYADRMGKSINYCVVGADMVGRGHMLTSFGSMGAGIITVNGVPHNSMDEFDWPVSDSTKAQCMDFQFKARKAYKMETILEEGDNTYIPRKGLEGVTLKPNEAEDRIWEADNFYPHVMQLNEVPETIEDNKLVITSSAWDRLDKKLSDGFKRDELCCFGSYMLPEEFIGNPSLSMVTELIANNKKAMIVGLENQYVGVSNVILSLDWDDVMYHLMQKNIEFVEREYGIKDIHNVITDYYYLYRNYPMIADMLWNHPENYISGDLVDGALDFYQDLVKLVGEHRIQIVTSSMENIIPLKDKMIKERFGINCKVIHAVFGKYKKHEFTKNTLLIDDHVGNILDHENHNGFRGIVFNHMELNYIKELSMKHDLIYTTTFDEILEEVKKIFKIKE